VAYCEAGHPHRPGGGTALVAALPDLGNAGVVGRMPMLSCARALPVPWSTESRAPNGARVRKARPASRRRPLRLEWPAGPSRAYLAAWLALAPAERLRRAWALRTRLRDPQAAHDAKTFPKL
jgi:hypothetical protein